MRKLKHLFLSFLLAIALLFGGCEVISQTMDGSGEQNYESEQDKADLPISGQEDDDSDVPDDSQNQDEQVSKDTENEEGVVYGEAYTSKDEVALYLHLYKELPPNFITKNEAKKLGWVSNKGNLAKVAPGMSIGGDKFGNYEGVLPEGKKYHECDIDSDGGYRNSKRIVYSNDGCIYYTEDHYETFELLYGEE